MIRGYRYQLDPNTTQRKWFARAMGSARYTYNWALEQRINAYQQEKKRLTAYDLCNMLTVLKNEDGKEWMYETPNVCLQYAIRNMDSAFTGFFRHKKGFPKFRSKHGKQRIQFINYVVVDFEKSKIRLPKIGWVRIHNPRRFEGKMGTVTVSLNAAGKYFVSILVHTPDPIPEKRPINEDTAVGVDVGLKEFAVLSDGTRIASPRHYQNAEKRLSVLQRRLSRKKKGSNRRKRAKLAVAKCHYRIANQRKDFLHKLTSRLIKNHDSIVIEDLNVVGMLKNHCLAKHIQSASWSEFFRQLEYKCEWSGKSLIRIGRFEPSSRMCTCGVVNKELTLKDRTWKCPSCGEVHDRDLLAARNIKRFGLNKQNLIGQDSGAVSPVEDAEEPALAGPMKRQCKKPGLAP
jgi:putative transposase